MNWKLNETSPLNVNFIKVYGSPLSQKILLMRKDRWFRILKFFSKRCDFWKFSNLRKLLNYNCFKNITDSHKLNYFKILIFFLENLLFERTHLLFENSSSWTKSSTSQKVIYFKKVIYFSKTHLLFVRRNIFLKKVMGGRKKKAIVLDPYFA